MVHDLLSGPGGPEVEFARWVGLKALRLAEGFASCETGDGSSNVSEIRRNGPVDAEMVQHVMRTFLHNWGWVKTWTWPSM